MMNVQVKTKTKMGTLYISASDKGIITLSWYKNEALKVNDKGNQHTDLVISELQSYFMGGLKKFSCKFDFETMNGTDFQVRVWKELLNIPYGEVKSYQDIAVKLGDKNLVRAVGGANGMNRVPILIPCHRVISKTGGLGGYAGGVELKRKLLKVEGVVFDKNC